MNTLQRSGGQDSQGEKVVKVVFNLRVLLLSYSKEEQKVHGIYRRQ